MNDQTFQSRGLRNRFESILHPSQGSVLHGRQQRVRVSRKTLGLQLPYLFARHEHLWPSSRELSRSTHMICERERLGHSKSGCLALTDQTRQIIKKHVEHTAKASVVNCITVGGSFGRACEDIIKAYSRPIFPGDIPPSGPQKQRTRSFQSQDSGMSQRTQQLFLHPYKIKPHVSNTFCHNGRQVAWLTIESPTMCALENCTC